jgi:hypothetical protein
VSWSIEPAAYSFLSSLATVFFFAAAAPGAFAPSANVHSSAMQTQSSVRLQAMVRC